MYSWSDIYAGPLPCLLTTQRQFRVYSKPKRQEALWERQEGWSCSQLTAEEMYWQSWIQWRGASGQLLSDQSFLVSSDLASLQVRNWPAG